MRRILTVVSLDLATAVEAALAAGAQAGSDLTREVAITAGQRVGLRVTKVALLTLAPQRITASLELV